MHLARFMMILLLLTKRSAFACPYLIFNNDLRFELKGERSEIRLFTERQGSFLELPIEILPTDKEGRFRFFNDDRWYRDPLESLDLIAFSSTNQWGRRIDLGAKGLPCRGPTVVELRIDSREERFAYLTSCKNFSRGQNGVSTIDFDLTKHNIQSERYLYEFNSTNYMEFTKILLRQSDNSLLTVAEDSGLYIHANLEPFGSLTFESGDIESRLENYREGSVVSLARLSFFLRVLSFSIKMNLSTDVGFFSESAHIPMQLYIPIDASKYVNPGSGILYSWRSAQFEQSYSVEMPIFDFDKVMQGWGNLSEYGLPFCTNGKCSFRYSIVVRNRLLSMDLEFEEEIVKRGFFPIYVRDVASIKKQMGWKFHLGETEKREGLYFETSGLKSGNYPWGFWLRLGGVKGSSGCPANLSVSRYL